MRVMHLAMAVAALCWSAACRSLSARPSAGASRWRCPTARRVPPAAAHRSSVFRMDQTRHEQIAVGALAVRFLVLPEDSRGSVSVFECLVPAAARR